MHSRLAPVFGLCTLASLAPHAFAAPPVAPVVTMGVDIKQLQFDWKKVPNSAWYDLWFKANADADWIKYTEVLGAEIPRIRINVSVHLLDWRVARYRLAACNVDGCTNSNELGVADLVNQAIGYFKPNTTAYNHYYGAAVALSADGKTFAALSSENFGSAQDSATVHVYRKTSGTSLDSGWRREARLTPSATQGGTTQPRFGGSPLALSGDGNLLALGVPTEDALGPNTPNDTGAVYLFRRSGSQWHLEQKITGEPLSTNYFGTQVELDDAGTTLAITHQHLNAVRRAETGTTDLYHYDGTGWQYLRTLSVPWESNGSSAQYCLSISLSGDGQTLFRSCFDQDTLEGEIQVFRAPGWDADGEVSMTEAAGVDSTYDGTRFVARDRFNNAKVYDWRAGAWALDGQFSMGFANYNGANLAISRDGAIVAGGDFDDTRTDTGVLYPGFQPQGSVHSGAVYVFERKSVGWRERRIVKPALQAEQAYGTVVALGDRGRVLAVGSFGDASAAVGIGGDPTDQSAPERGAAWLY